MGDLLGLVLHLDAVIASHAQAARPWAYRFSFPVLCCGTGPLVGLVPLGRLAPARAASREAA